ncbi:hypothetical protein H480_38385 [Amycolatopsis vancoresmycina DSM 44592]|uniref:Uncharacterized protein n=1 Tax=Amycolatopsis vancoresmycina DSM 44592 TaxID=1292037 RepID=R1FUV5_9PSEU|nr:hypothetical protein H480_38385 [Amycolatopsis vancoresmycina DSM 44592]
MPYRLDSALPCVVTVSFVVSLVDGTSEVDGVADAGGADEDGAGAADVDGAVTLGGGACATAAVFCTGPGSNRQTAMNPATDSATTKMVFFTEASP